MKLLLDIKDAKVSQFMEVLKGLNYVKAKPLSPYKAKILEDLREAVEEMALIKSGKLKGRSAEDLMNEL